MQYDIEQRDGMQLGENSIYNTDVGELMGQIGKSTAAQTIGAL